MHAHEQLAALEDGRIDVGLTRPLNPPFDRTFRSELLYNDPVVVAVRPEHPFAGAGGADQGAGGAAAGAV